MQMDPLKDGWGATTDGRHLIVSDGSANISFLDPNSLQLVRSVAVKDNGKSVPMLNEVSITSTGFAYRQGVIMSYKEFCWSTLQLSILAEAGWSHV